METISMLLTAKQTERISELFVLVDRAYDDGKPGMIAGQFFRSSEGEGFMDVGFLDGDKAKEMLRAMGRPEIEARASCEVYTDIEP